MSHFGPDRKDFWNDPDRLDGVTDPHTQIFWMHLQRRRDVIDVNVKPDKATPPLNYSLLALGQLHAQTGMRPNLDDLLNARPGSIIRMY